MFSNFKFNLGNKTTDETNTQPETAETPATTSTTPSATTSATTSTTTSTSPQTETTPSLTDNLFNINFDGEEHKVSAAYLVSMIEKQGDIIDNLKKENLLSPLVLKKDDKEVRLSNVECLNYIKQLNDNVAYLLGELKNCHHVFSLISEKYDLSEYMTKPPEMEDNEEVNINLDEECGEN